MNTQTFAGIPTQFADRETADVGLQSIPYDGTSTWGKGADQGFEAFMDAAANMELYDIETDTEVYQRGVHMLPELGDFTSPEDMFRKVYVNTKELLQSGKFLTFFGGEHSISIGLIKAHYEHFDNLTVLQIDAHADLRPDYEGTKYNHACAVYDASKNCNLIQVGIRSMEKEESQHMNRRKTWFAQDMHGHGRWMYESIDKMTDKIYITFDLDAFDPGLLPGTGTPEPGGLGWYETLRYLRKVFTQRNVVGFDIVELAPIKGNSASQFAAAKLYYKMLTYKFLSKP
jgi:agmatinase